MPPGQRLNYHIEKMIDPQKLRENTWVTKEHIVRTKILPYFKDRRINEISAADADKYFATISVELTAIPSTAYTSVSELPDKFYIENVMAKNQMVMKDDISKSDPVMDKYKSGYEVTSFAAESFDYSVNGSLRHGDVVDVYAVDPATETLMLMAENVYVDEVYDNFGNKITDDEGVATSFTVWVTPEEVESINTAVVYGGIQIYLKTE